VTRLLLLLLLLWIQDLFVCFLHSVAAFTGRSKIQMNASREHGYLDAVHAGWSNAPESSKTYLSLQETGSATHGPHHSSATTW
jgi:urease accessory protein UreH